jgi:rubrerythrin
VNIHEGDRMNVYALLSAERSIEQPLAVVRAALGEHKPRLEAPRYFSALKRALWEEAPPFATELYANLYRTAAASGQWLAMSLMTDAEREAAAAKHLWSLAARTDNEGERHLLKRHACDEANHTRTYLTLLDLSFPGAIAPPFRSELDQLSPQFSMEKEFAGEGSRCATTPSLDDYIEMNLAEIRKTIRDLMRREALAAHCPTERMAQITELLNSLLRDELNHVAYTAMQIERKTDACQPNELQAEFCKRLRNFNRVMSEEPIEYSYNQRFGNYP